MKKFILTNETKKIKTDNGSIVTLHRICALRSFDNIDAGDLGGWVEKESNLSQSGNAWIYDEAKVFGDASVEDDAVVTGHAVVMGKARIHDHGLIMDNAIVKCNCCISDCANVCESAKIFGKVSITGESIIGGHAMIISPRDFMSIGPFEKLLRWYVTFYHDARTGISVSGINSNGSVYTCTTGEFIDGDVFDIIPKKQRVSLSELAAMKVRHMDETPDGKVRNDNEKVRNDNEKNVTSPIYFFDKVNIV